MGPQEGRHLADLTPLERAVPEIWSAVQHSGRAWVIGAEGTGRTTLAHILLRDKPARRKRSPHLVWIPPGGADVATHVLVQLAAVEQDVRLRTRATDDGLSLDERVRAIGESLAREGQPIVLLAPSAWSPDRVIPESDDPEGFRLLEVLRALMSVDNLPLVLLTSRLYEAGTLPWNSHEVPRLRLDRVRINRAAMDEECLWGTLLREAQRVKEAIHAVDPVPPIAVRLLVALTALGRDLEDALSASRGQDVTVLTERLIDSLRNPQAQGLRDAAVRVAQSRFRIDVNLIGGMCPTLDARERDVLTSCLGYGERYRMIASVRSALLSNFSLSADNLASTHALLANAHHAQDGAPRPADARGSKALHWLEALHHLGHQGPSGQRQWKKTALQEAVLPRDILWDCARSLSRDYHEYALAAEIYQRSLRDNGDDSYSWHYLAFNLEKARLSPERAESAYRKAVEMEPQNPWWNSRFVCFLVSRARFRQAEEFWKDSTARIASPADDPQREAWLARHMHRWVAEKWLDHGRPWEARLVLQAIKANVRNSQPQLRKLESRLQDALEVELLGNAVYPTSYPIDARWHRPPTLPESCRGTRLAAWHPARVVRISDREVHLVVASTEEDPEQRILMDRTFSADDWEVSAGQPAVDARGFYFLGEYDDGRVVVIPMEVTHREEQCEPMSYLDFWHGRQAEPVRS